MNRYEFQARLTGEFQYPGRIKQSLPRGAFIRDGNMGNQMSTLLQDPMYFLKAFLYVRNILDGFHGQDHIDAVRLEWLCFKNAVAPDKIEGGASESPVDCSAVDNKAIIGINAPDADSIEAGEVERIGAPSAPKIDHGLPFCFSNRSNYQPRSHSRRQVDNPEDAYVEALEPAPAG